MESITVSARSCLRTSPTLFVDPSDAMRSKCSLNNLRVAWPGTQWCSSPWDKQACNEHNYK
ncbi:hypothetical protein OUZ56_024104 [Daphnia magna]|uniref:Uncharacterized protein n=1 Tax=Daphnia magna TaxID=35525 RepID=A0ABR0B0A8_9CRUS|nr:hypothetical protein OUZ56_024104 [Daphnia magna]